MSLVDSLVAYKGRPAKIISSTTHKFDLTFTDGSSRKVREKDFRYIHPDGIKSGTLFVSHVPPLSNKPPVLRYAHDEIARHVNDVSDVVMN